MSTRYNTGNPIESTDVRDMSDNAQNLDLFSLSGDDAFQDRLGNSRKTLTGAVKEIGIPIIGDFTTGCTVTTVNQGVQEIGGSVYRWKGALPKLVPPSSTPSGTGGISPSGDWVDVGDASTYTRIKNDLANNGAAIVGYGSGTVESALNSNASDINQLESDIASIESRVLNTELESKVVFARSNQGAALFVNGKKGLVILGDSISAGAFAGNLYSNGWARLLARSVNGELGAGSYGFTPMLTLGDSQPYESIDIHNVSFVNVGSGWSAKEGSNGSTYLNGFAFRSINSGNKITFSLPSFMRRALIHHANQAGGGSFTITVNGTLVATVNTSSNTDASAVTEVATPDNQYGAVTIIIEATNNLPVDILGVSYLSSALEPCVQNFSTSGRRSHDVGLSVLNTVLSNSSAVIFALGHNDFGATDPTYIAETTQVITNMITSANSNGTKIIVPDFCWSAPSSNWMRTQLKRLAKETNGVYIDFPKMFAKNDGSPADSTWLINNLGLFVDGSHPNAKGNEFIFEVIAKSMRLSCTSKSQALTMHDYWLSLPLQPAATVQNSIVTIPSAVKRTPSGVSVRLFIQQAQAAGNAFPAGTYAMATSYPARSGIGTIQGQLSPVMRADGTALVGGVVTNASGSISLNVFSGGATFKDIALSYQIS